MNVTKIWPKMWLAAWLCFAQPPAPAASDWLDQLDDALYLESPSGWFRSDLSGLLDLEAYYIDQRPPGLLVSDDDWLLNPRLSLFVDTRLGPHFYSLVHARIDRGFDPGVDKDGDARLDEYLLRYTPFEEGYVNVQAGKFATVVGNWVSRHDSWRNPFINAPLPYERLVPITDHTVPGASGLFLARRDRPDQIASWLPIIWGPSYATGGAVFGLVEKIEYAVEIKNASISSRPYAWDATTVGWEYPTVSGRIGYRPNATWNVCASVSYGAYLLPPTRAALPPGRKLGDFKQINVGHDISYSWRHWQIWAEAFASRFEVPNVGDADTLAWYLEAKYKFTPRLFGALRWNHQIFDTIRAAGGGRQRWDYDAWRMDAAVGYRFDRHWQTKLQYSYNHQQGPLSQGEQLVAAQVTLKF